MAAYIFAQPMLTSHFKTNNLKGFGIENLEFGIVAAGVILHYLAETEHRELGHINKITRLEAEQFVWLDRFTIRNLELVFAQQEGGVPLIDILDKTVTPMGARLLRKWIVLPLKEKAAINERLETVRMFVEKPILQENILYHLKQIGDLERLISKVAVRRISPRELVTLKRALQKIAPIKSLLLETRQSQIVEIPEPDNTPKPAPDLFTHIVEAIDVEEIELPIELIGKTESTVLKKYSDQLNPCAFLLENIEKTLRDDAPMVMNQGNMIKKGIDPQLDELLDIAYSGKDYLVKLQIKESARSGISSLKIAFNKVFGYYLRPH